MSVDNTVTRPERDVEPEAAEAGFKMPPDLAERYDVRVIPAKDPNEIRMGMFRPGDRGEPSIEIMGNGDRIVARNEDPETVAALVKIARHNGWEGIDVDGSPEFRKAVWEAGAREGLTVRGYEPKFEEQERIADLRRADEARRDREAAAKPTPVVEQVAPIVAAVAIEAAAPARVVDVRREAGAGGAPAQGDAKLSDSDRRLLLTLSRHGQDQQTLNAPLGNRADPFEREVLNERIDANREALKDALKRALESPTLVSAFERAGYEPEGLREKGIASGWDPEVAEAVYVVRSGLHRDAVEVEQGPDLDEVMAGREDRLVAESIARAGREPEPESYTVREERRQGVAADRDANEELAELFLRGNAERIAADPRLANAVEAQAAMEQHISVAFDGDADRIMSANLESRELISAALSRGLDVSVREPAPVRQVESIQITPDLER